MTDNLLLEYQWIVNTVLHKHFRYYYYPRSIECADLQQEGFVALILAHRAYSEDRPASFSTFAYNHIRWHLTDFLILQTWGPSVRTRLRRKKKGIQEQYGMLNYDELPDLAHTVINNAPYFSRLCLGAILYKRLQNSIENALRRNNKDKYCGVTAHTAHGKRHGWRAAVQLVDKPCFIGLFDTKDEASKQRISLLQNLKVYLENRYAG